MKEWEKLMGKTEKWEKFVTVRVNDYLPFSMSDSSLPCAQDFDRKTPGSGQMENFNNLVKFMTLYFNFLLVREKNRKMEKVCDF